MFSLEESYSVVLPEKLDSGKWNVYRLKKLISFASYFEILLRLRSYVMMIIIIGKILFLAVC